MLSDGESIVACEEDVSVRGLAGLVDRVENAADLMIDGGDHRVVIGDVAADLVGLAWESCQHLVANLQLAVVERMFRQEVRGQFHLCGIVHAVKRRRGRSRIMRRSEGDIQEVRGLFVGTP